MSDAPRDLVKFLISNAPGTVDGFTVAAAAPGYLTLGALDNALPFKLHIVEAGVGSEIRKGCIFAWNGGVGSTLTRGTMVRSTGAADAALAFTSAALVSVVASAEDFLTTDRVSAFNTMLVNVGTEAVPIWELEANLIPRTDTLAYLTGLLNGGGELCSATDVPAIVQLNGTPGSGTAAVYSPMPPTMLTINSNGRAASFQPPGLAYNPYWNDSNSYILTIQSQNNVTSVGGKLEAVGGNSENATGGILDLKSGYNTVSGGQSSGAINITTPGTNVTASGKRSGHITVSTGAVATAGASSGNIALTTGSGTNTAGAGDITLTVGTGGEGVGVNEGGAIFLKTGTNTVVKVGPLVNTLGFFNATPVTKPAVAGSKASGAALDSLLTALSSLGLIDISGVTA